MSSIPARSIQLIYELKQISAAIIPKVEPFKIAVYTNANT